MSFITKIKDTVQKIPVLRRPAPQSKYDNYLADFGWTLQKRNKAAGIGWETYYQAMRNVWINACIQVYIDEIINLGFVINNPDNQTVNTKHVNYLTNFFDYPMGLSQEDTFASFNILMWKSYLGLGDAFCEVISDPQFNNIPIGLNHIPTELMHYYEDTDQWGLRDQDIRFEKDQLIHIKDPNIRGGIWGESKIDVLAKDITLEILGRERTNDILKNKGLDPSGVLEYDADMDDEAWNNEIARMQAMSKQNVNGSLIVRGAKYSKVANTNHDMEFIELMKDVRDRILATYGVPPSKVSIIETANLGSGSGQSQAENFKKRFKGNARIFEDAYKKVLGRSIFKETFSYGDMDIDDKLVQAQIENIRIHNGSSYINEVRKEHGKEPVDWGNVPISYGQFGIATGTDSIEEITSLDLLGQPTSSTTVSTSSLDKELKRYQKALLYERLKREYK